LPKKDFTNKEVFTTDEIAKLCHVTQNSVINWIKSSVLVAYKTPGGHRRIKRRDFLDFIKQNNMPVPGPLVSNDRTVLVVIENPGLRREVVRKLSSFGEKVSVHYSLSLFEGGMKFEKLKPDIIILDFWNTIEKSFEIARIIKDNEGETPNRIMALFESERSVNLTQLEEFKIEGFTTIEDFSKNLQKFIQQHF
jgi:excisionase family DNA binding protein